MPAVVVDATAIPRLVPLAVGVKVAVAPVGNPETPKLTVPEKPLNGLTLITSVPLPPFAIGTLFEADSSLNDGAAVTLRVTPTEAVAVP